MDEGHHTRVRRGDRFRHARTIDKGSPLMPGAFPDSAAHVRWMRTEKGDGLIWHEDSRVRWFPSRSCLPGLSKEDRAGALASFELHPRRAEKTRPAASPFNVAIFAPIPAPDGVLPHVTAEGGFPDRRFQVFRLAGNGRGLGGFPPRSYPRPAGFRRKPGFRLHSPGKSDTVTPPAVLRREAVSAAPGGSMCKPQGDLCTPWTAGKRGTTPIFSQP